MGWLPIAVLFVGCWLMDGEPIKYFPTQERVVALTFDDGPSTVRTPKLLDMLQRQQVAATFFTIGRNVVKCPMMVKRMVAEGHQVANHSFSHDWSASHEEGAWSEEMWMQDIAKADRYLKLLGARDTSYFRPPYGKRTPQLDDIFLRAGKKIIMWNIDPSPEQYQRPLNGAKLQRAVLRSIQPGAIILLHDGKNRDVEHWVQAVEQIIVSLRARGYRFITVAEGMQYVTARQREASLP